MGRVVLHIGVMKTGTTFVQAVLQRNQEQLDALGFAYLGGGFGAQARAVREGLGGRGRRAGRRWRRLAAAARADERTSVVSMEFLSFAGDAEVARFLEPFRHSRVDVVVTVRDELRVIPAQWQTYCRNFGTSSWERYLREIEPARRRTRHTLAAKTFHRAQSVPAILDRWQRSPLVSGVHVVTVPGRGAPPDELWNRFAAAAGLPPGHIDLRVPEDNSSLGYGSCEFTRRANRWLVDVPPARYRKGMRRLAREALAPRRGLESKPELDRRAARVAADLNSRIRDRLSSGRFEVYGDLDDLPVPDDLAEFPRRPPGVPPAEARAAAEAAWRLLRDELGMGTDRPPRRLRRLVHDTTLLLRQANGWDSGSDTLSR